MRRIFKKRKCTLDRTMFITTEETLFYTESYNIIDLVRAWMAITDATLDREKRDEREVSSMKKELDHL